MVSVDVEPTTGRINRINGNRTRSKGKDILLTFTSDPRKFAREERQKVREQEKLLALKRITPDSIEISLPLFQIDEQTPSAPIADTPQQPTAPIEYSHTPPANPFYEFLKPKAPLSPEIDVSVKTFPATCGQDPDNSVLGAFFKSLSEDTSDHSIVVIEDDDIAPADRVLNTTPFVLLTNHLPL